MSNNIRKIFIVLLFLVLSAGTAQSRSAPDNGIQREYFEDGTLQLEVHYRNEVVVRKRTYYRNGQPMSNFKNDKRGAPLVKKTFHENGRLKSVWTRKSRQTRYYHDDGRVRMIIDDNKPGPASILRGVNKYESRSIILPTGKITFFDLGKYKKGKSS